MDRSESIDRQAIVIIHGIGEQRPMSTLRSFAEAIPKIERNSSKGVQWSKPDTVSEGFEHHRLTLPSTSSRPVTDVYELYWAHLFEQTNPTTFLSWIKHILLRPLPSLPRRFRAVAICIWISLIAGIGAWLFFLDHAKVGQMTALLTLPALAVIYTVVLYAVNNLFLGTISDAARYLDASPRNVEARNNVRKLGVSFLERLHNSDRNYGRIVVCGHSLGTVIGYDILQRLWYKVHEKHGSPERPDQDAQKKLAEAAADLDGAKARELQRDLWLEQLDMGNKWRITDFVTLGSP